jgi:hypothetical protein
MPPRPRSARCLSCASRPGRARLANAAGRCLTCRSTGRATARHPGREALSAYHPPRGQGAMPPRAGYLYVRRHEIRVTCFLFGPRLRALGWHGPRALAPSGRRVLKRHLVCQHRQFLLSAPFSCQRHRASAPRRVLLRSRPSAFAGARRGHPVCQLRLRCAAATAAARCWPSRFVFNSPGAPGSAACKRRRRGSWAPRSAAPLRLPGVGALNTGMPPNMAVNRSANGMAPGPRSARCPCCASRPRHHAVVARLPLR